MGTKQQNGGTGEIIQTAPNAEQNNIIDPNDNTNDGTDTEGSTKGGLTSEERVLLREKKKARLQKNKNKLGKTIYLAYHHKHRLSWLTWPVTVTKPPVSQRAVTLRIGARYPKQIAYLRAV